MIAKNDLIDWLEKIDKKLERNIILIAVGGTALTLLGLKLSTRDVDFCVESKDEEAFKKAVENDKFKVDIFKDGYIFSQQLPDDYVKNSTEVITNLDNIDLKSLSLIDIIITKATRYNERDEEDIKTIVKKVNIDKEELKRRFSEVIETFVGNKKDFEYHFNLIIKMHFNK